MDFADRMMKVWDEEMGDDDIDRSGSIGALKMMSHKEWVDYNYQWIKPALDEISAKLEREKKEK